MCFRLQIYLCRLMKHATTGTSESRWEVPQRTENLNSARSIYGEVTVEGTMKCELGKAVGYIRVVLSALILFTSCHKSALPSLPSCLFRHSSLSFLLLHPFLFYVAHPHNVFRSRVKSFLPHENLCWTPCVNWRNWKLSLNHVIPILLFILFIPTNVNHHLTGVDRTLSEEMWVT